MIHNGSKSYERGCRCEPCRTLHNAQVAKSRAERLASGRLSHGTRSAYDAGCRCEPCRIVHRDGHREYYRARESGT